jgi:uncharacterized protein (TIGR02001 family)
MHTKSIAMLLGVAAAGALPLWAQTTPAAAPAAVWSQSFTPTYVSQYMFRGVRLGGPSLQGDYDASLGPWDLGLWANVPLADRVPGQSNPEIDPYGSYTWTVNDSFSVEPGFTLYTYPKAPTDQGFYRATFEPNLALNYTIDGVKITPKYYYDLVAEGPTYELNAAYDVPLKSLGTELDFLGTLGTYEQVDVADHTEPRMKSWGNYWLLGVSLPYQITKQTKLTLGWAYTEGTDAYYKQAGIAKAVNTAAVGRGVFSAGLTWSF